MSAWLPVVVLLVGCGGGSQPSTAGTSTTTATSTTAPPATTPATTTAATAAPAVVVIGLRVEDRVGVDGFAEEVRATLTDPRGWQQAGFAFEFPTDPAAAPYVVVLADGAEVDDLCAPYDVDSTYSCQIGPVVALNADRWRTATPEWTGDLATYRQMLVNHEVGHLLGRHHPDPQCETSGAPAPVMAQQSTELPETGCLPNPWPLPWEIACAARHDEPVAPPYEPDAEATCGPDG